MKPTITAFGAAIRRERIRRNMSQRDVAKATKISAPYINQMETNDFVPRPSYVERIAKCFDGDPLKWLKLAMPDQFKVWERAFRPVEKEK